MVCRCLFVACVLALAGCGGQHTMKVEPPSAAEEAARELEKVAGSGVVDSAIFLVREKLEEMDDQAKADAMLGKLDELESLKDKARVKQLAGEMISELRSSPE